MQTMDLVGILSILESGAVSPLTWDLTLEGSLRAKGERER
jgi:hypothetical protein